MTLDRNGLIDFVQRRYTEVPWFDDQTVRIRSLTELERSQLEKLALDGKPELVRARAITLCLVNESGSRVLGDGKDDLNFVLSLDTRASNRLWEVIQAHCGVGGEDLEETAKN